MRGSEEQPAGSPAGQPPPDCAPRREVPRDDPPQHQGLSIDRLPLAYIRLDADHRVLDWNLAAESMFGYTREEIVGEDLPTRILPEPIGDHLGDIVRRLHAGDMRAHSVNENRTKDGRVITCEWFNTPLTDSEGRFAGVVSLARDVSDELRTAEQLAESQRRFHAVFENSIDSILLMDDAGRYVDANPAACQLLGYTREEIIRLNVADVTQGVDREKIPELMSQFLAAGTLHGEYTLVCSDGTTREVEYRSVANILPGLHLGVHRDITERRQAERTLRESHSLLTAVVEGVPQALFVKDRRGRYLLLNTPGARLAGKEVADVLGRDDTALFDPETARRFTEADRQVMESGSGMTYEEVGTTAGASRTYLTTKAPFLGPDGEISGVIGVALDVTVSRAAEEDLRRQKEVLQTIFDHIPVMIRFAEPSGRVQLVNRQWEEVLGWSLEDVRGRNLFTDLYPELYPDPDDRQRALDFALQSAGKWSDFRIRARDGRILETAWTGIVLSDGTLIGIGFDVTERRRVERALRAAEARYRAIFDQADVGIVAAALDDWSLFSPNPGFCRMIGYSPEEIGRLTVAHISHPEDVEVGLTLARRLVAGDIPSYSLEKRYVRKDGEVVWVTLTCSLICKPSGEPDFVVGVLQDITGRKKAEAEQERLHTEVVGSRAELEVLSRRLIEAQEVERSHLARELHDEIGQVLTTVNLTLEGVRARVGPAAAERIDESRRAVDRAIEQVRSLSLDLRPASLDLLGLEPALRAYLVRQTTHAGLSLAFTCSLGDERLPPSLETACFRVLQEATTNVLRHARATRLEVVLKRNDAEVRLTIRDDGAGFDLAAARGRVLRGEGLGLVGMRERIQLFGGRIEVESAPGKGTTIEVSLPIVDDPESPGPP
jgi:PAS domain S-box-containing protein